MLGKDGCVERRPSLHMSASIRSEVTVAAQFLCGFWGQIDPWTQLCGFDSLHH